jgi:methyl-accepting chemotaxis protein PixJ
MTISENALTSSPETSTPADTVTYTSETTSETTLESSNGLGSQNRIREKKTPPVANKKGSTLRNRLLLTVLPTVLIPLAIASVVGILFAQRQSKDALLNNLEQGVFLTSETTEKFPGQCFSYY